MSPSHPTMNTTASHNTTTTNVNHTAAPAVNLANQRKRKASTLLTGDDIDVGNYTKQLFSASNRIKGGQVNPCVCQCHCAGSSKAKNVAEYLDSLPTGYQFMPTDEELISHYLRKKIKNQSLPKTRIIEANVYENHPKDLAAAYPQAIKDAWYFFSSRDKKYSRGNRPSRNAGPGYWKATCVNNAIKRNETTIGGRKSLAYYEGRQPKGTKTNWLMYEYVVVEGSDDKKFDDYVLCKIYKKKIKEQDVASNSHEENLTTDIEDQNEQADQNNAVIQFPNHQSMNNNNIDEVMAPYQQTYVASNQDVHPTHLQGENNHVVVQQSSKNSNCINGGQVNPCGCHCAGSTKAKNVAEYLDSLPIGYRFMPTDEELISHYLRKKIKNQSLPKTRIIEANLYENHPKDLAAAYPQATKDAWYFFSSRDKKYSRGNRPSRNAGPGYWRATGLDIAIKGNETTIGRRKSLAYYEGHQPKGTKTEWMMYEYVVKGGSDDKKFDDYVLCKIYKKKIKEEDVASNSHDENLTTDIMDQNEQADQNNVVTQFPNHQSMNNNIDQVMVPYHQAYVASIQDVHPTHFNQNNHVVVQQSSQNSNPTIQYVENILPIPGSSQNYSYVHPETYSCDPSSNPPSPEEAQSVLQGGNECDGRANVMRNIELMLAKEGYDWLNTDDDCEFRFDKLEERPEVDESEKLEESKVDDWINYFMDRE